MLTNHISVTFSASLSFHFNHHRQRRQSMPLGHLLSSKSKFIIIIHYSPLMSTKGHDEKPPKSPNDASKTRCLGQRYVFFKAVFFLFILIHHITASSTTSHHPQHLTTTNATSHPHLPPQTGTLPGSSGINRAGKKKKGR